MMNRWDSLDTRHNILGIIALLLGLLFVVEGLEPLGINGPELPWRLAIFLPIFLAFCIWLGLREVKAWKNLAESLGLKPVDTDQYYGLPPLQGVMHGYPIEVRLTHTGEKTRRSYYTTFQVRGKFRKPDSSRTLSTILQKGKLSGDEHQLSYQIHGYCFDSQYTRQVLQALITLAA